jgi:polysaccharide biosynthesis transport protein
MLDSDANAPARLRRLVVRQWWLVAICAVVACAASYYVASKRPKKYTSTAVVAVAAPDALAQLNGQSALDAPADTEARVASTVAALITQPEVLEQASAELKGLMTSSQLASALSVVVNSEANLITVSATASSPSAAFRVANVTVDTFIAQQQTQQVQSELSAQQAIRQRLRQLGPGRQKSPLAKLLDGRLQALQALDGGGSDISVAQQAQAPTAPSSPDTKRLALVGLVVGILLGLVVALLRARLNSRLYTERELRYIWGLPVIGSIPKSRQLKRYKGGFPPREVLDAFGLLTARLAVRSRRLSGKPIRTVLITSAEAGEGKTTCALQIAQASASTGVRVLLVEGDLRQPVLADRLGISAPLGLAAFLSRRASLDDVTARVSAYGSDREEAGFLDVIVAGEVSANPLGLIEQGGLGEALSSATDRWDLIIIDAPPAAVGDTVLLAGQVDAIVVVARLGVATRSGFAMLRDQLSDGVAVVAGLVINGASDRADYGYPTSAAAPSDWRQPSRADSSRATVEIDQGGVR